MSKETWNRFCSYYRNYPQVGISLDISRMHFTDTFLTSMHDQCEAAHKEMKELEAGAIANPDENRMVGHYWLRAPSLAPNQALTEAIQTQIQACKDFAKAVHTAAVRGSSDEPFTDVLLIGIGGSALGPQLLNDAFAWLPPKMALHFFDNTDPAGMEETLLELRGRLASTLVLVVSKSGGTVETKNGMLVASSFFKQQGLCFEKHAVAITVEGSKLDALAKESKWIDQLYLWDWVGGRTSIFSAVGLLPAALLGISIDEFQAGAARMDEYTRCPTHNENPAMLLALMWYWAGNGKGDKSMVVLPYKDSLVLFSKYLQQLVMESLGKEQSLSGEIVHQGISVFGNKGSTDQHAYVQQLRDGRSDFFVTFIEVLERTFRNTINIESIKVDQTTTTGDYLSGFYLGTRTALSEGGRESISITLDTVSANRLGALIALYERAVGLYASLIEINAYHQPGVEAGKKAAATVVALQRKIESAVGTMSGAFTAWELAEAIDAVDNTELVFKILCSEVSKADSTIECRTELTPSAAKFTLR